MRPRTVRSWAVAALTVALTVAIALPAAAQSYGDSRDRDDGPPGHDPDQSIYQPPLPGPGNENSAGRFRAELCVDHGAYCDGENQLADGQGPDQSARGVHSEMTEWQRMCVGGRVTSHGSSDYWPAHNPNHEMCSSSDPAGGAPVCVPSWQYTTHGPAWHGPDGTGEHWWGTRTIGNDGCGNSSVTRNVTCHATACVQIPADCAWDDVEGQIEDTEPDILTSPDGESLVQIATWFWHDEWDEYDMACAHPQAPAQVEVTAEPFDTWWDYGQGEKHCEDQPQEFDFSLLTGPDSDPDADCNSHRYTWPSLGTGDAGDDVYDLKARVNYEVKCEVSGVPGNYQLPGYCDSLYEDAPEAEFALPVFELQTVFR